jgi:3-oxoacyl-[acyl-carrier protein] reductase
VRNVLVTGGTRGLGLGIVRALARSGFRVVTVARRESDEFLATSARMADDGCPVPCFQAFDLERIDEISGIVKQLRGRFGAFHGLVNNAGIGTAGLLTNMPDGNIERLVRLNLTSPLTLTKYIVRSMMTQQGGRVVNISSVVGMTGYSGLSVYSATKASLIGFTRSLARELGPLGITVNAVAPGFVDTEMTHDLDSGQRAQIAHRSALKRMPDVDDVASAVDYLFSERARNVTGIVLTVDAGNTA